MPRIDVNVSRILALIGTLASTAACSSSNDASSGIAGSQPMAQPESPAGGQPIVSGGSPSGKGASGSSGGSSNGGSGPKAGVKDGDETDVDCGGSSGAKCGEGKSCLVDKDCDVACGYAKTCVSAPSCTGHLGGDTCGKGEVGEPGALHESCCRTLRVPAFTDLAHPGKTVYVDKYEITAGRIRTFVARLSEQMGGSPNLKTWLGSNRPAIWDDAWNQFLPTDLTGGVATIGRRLLGDPRVEDGTGSTGPGVILPPATDQARRMGMNYQFGSEIYVDLHGNNCGAFPDSYGFSTYYYPANLLAQDGQLPRASGLDAAGTTIAPQDLLDVKAMNCITNAMLAAFCAWDGGQLVTDEVLDFITETPASLGNISGCGSQYDNHGELLGNDFSHTVQTGGRCASVLLVNATFDAGDHLPEAGSPLNIHNYHYPDLGNVTHDKSWEVSAPGRASLAAGANGAQADVVRISPGSEPWMDLNGNLSEAALDVTGAAFTGNFALKYRGIGYGSARSDLNTTPINGETVLRVQRPEAKAAYTGGRCMRFK